jgi:hypothetical protein
MKIKITTILLAFILYTSGKICAASVQESFKKDECDSTSDEAFKTQLEIKERKRPKYTPLSKRQDRPDAILWLCKNAPELTDGQISKLVGSTKGTVSLIRKRSYWNFSNLKPRDPVILALCTQETFQKSLDKAKRRVEREKKAKIREEKKAQAASA